ncbi:putative killer cell immunoglobulin-like receptor-like protein KIR3DX1 [Rhynchocyon petersi]
MGAKGATSSGDPNHGPTELNSTTDESHKPILTAWPSPVIPLGANVTLQCRSHLNFVKFKVLHKRGTAHTEYQDGFFSDFTMSSVTRAHTGTYKCSGYYSSRWSAYSEPLEIVVTGLFTKPSILAHPSFLVNSGRNVTLSCASEILFDKFILHKEENSQHSHRVGKRLETGNSWADFFMEPTLSVHAGTYRCYGSHSQYPYEWSKPSDPQELIITGIVFTLSVSF